MKFTYKRIRAKIGLKWFYFKHEIYVNKTLYGALTRWGYLNTHITAHDTCSIQPFKLRLSPSKAEKCNTIANRSLIF